MQQLSILIVGGVAVLFVLLSAVRVKRLHVHTDRFAKAFCRAYDHLLPTPEVTETLRCERSEGGAVRALAAAEQPEPICALLEQGVDAFILDCLHEMYAERDAAQALLTSVNLVGNKFNAALNRCYDLANRFFGIVENPARLKTEDDLECFSTYLNKQKFLRQTTLASIISDECKTEITAEQR